MKSYVAPFLLVLAMTAASCSSAPGEEAAPTEGRTAGDPTANTVSDVPGDTVRTTTAVAGSTTRASSVVPATTEPPLPSMPTVEIDLGQVDQGFAEWQGLTGGLGFPVVMVTSAEDSGPGTYRDAISTGNRIVRFDPSLNGATISLEEPVETAASNLTIDGNGTSVVVTNHATRFNGTNIVIAGMTFSGNDATDEEDAITFRNTETNQVFGLYGNTFELAADGLVDVIWNHGNDVYGTICGNVFRHHDKAVLIDSGDRNVEGGRYFVTFCYNYWLDVYQRAPLSRYGYIHQYNSVFERYGKADGTGGGSKSGGDGEGVSQHLLQGNMVFPRAVGESTFDGQTVSAPRAEWAASQLDTDGGVKVEGNLLGTTGDVTATEVEHDVDEVFSPPYEYTLRPASELLAGVVRAYAGACVPSGRLGAINPCAPLLVPGNRELFVDVLPSAQGESAALVSAVEFVVGDQRIAAVQVDETRWMATLAPLEAAPTAAWAVVTTSDGRQAISDLVMVSSMANGTVSSMANGTVSSMANGTVSTGG